MDCTASSWFTSTQSESVVCSSVITMLPAGSRVHVVETRRMADGGERAHVMIAAVDTDGNPAGSSQGASDAQLAHGKPIGW